MLAHQIDGGQTQAASHTVFAQRLRQHSAVNDEMVELAGVLQSRASLPHVAVPGLQDTPLCFHAADGIRTVLTAVGWLTAERWTPFQAGVLPLAARHTELLFVTVDKSEGYHDRNAYLDSAICAEGFHWRTQNSAGRARQPPGSARCG
jgi:hypothetical protein